MIYDAERLWPKICAVSASRMHLQYSIEGDGRPARIDEAHSRRGVRLRCARRSTAMWSNDRAYITMLLMKSNIEMYRQLPGATPIHCL